MKELELQACVYSRTAPEEAQLRAFLNQKYRRPVRLRWERDERMKDGFRLELGEGESRELVYDWSSAGKSRQLKDRIAAAIRSRSDVIPLLEKTLREFRPEPTATEIGTVLSYGDGIAEVSGLPGADYGREASAASFLRERPPFRPEAPSGGAEDLPVSRLERLSLGA